MFKWFRSFAYLGHTEIDFWDENFKNILVWNHKAYSLAIWYEASSSGHLPSLFKLWSVGQKWACPGGHMFYIGLYRENMKKIFLSEATRPKVLIFGM